MLLQKKACKKLEGKILAHHQEKRKGELKLVAADECAMVSQQQLRRSDLTLKEAIVDERKFGGRVVAMFGDPVQLPAAMASTAWTGTYRQRFDQLELVHGICNHCEVDRK